MTLEPDLVFRKITLIGPDLQELKRLASLDIGEYLSDVRNELVAERLLERIIGRMIDINYHVVTARGQPPPKDYHSSFIALGQATLIDPDLASNLAKCAGLRNRIAHMYDDIDPRLVHAALASALRDIPRYIDMIRAYVEAERAL